MSHRDLRLRYEAAVALAREAGDLAMTYYRDDGRLGLKMKGFQDYITEADRAVEMHLRSRFAEMFSSDGFFGEEGGGEAAEALWIVDPIDGTANFARGEPYWGISIGYVRSGVPEIGVVFVPVLGELFAALRGDGATLNGAPIRASATQEMASASIEIGWSPRRPTSSYIGLIASVMELGGSVRRSASGALGMAWVACGRSDAYLELHINCWDVAGGFVLAREAGAAVSDYFSGDWLRNGNPIAAATPALAEPLVAAMGIQPAAMARKLD